MITCPSSQNAQTFESNLATSKSTNSWCRVLTTLQQKVSLYAKWFHWVLSEFIGCSEWGPMKK
jgi:hypothetical protein